MPTQFIDTNALPSVKTAYGANKEVLNEQIAGAKNVKAILHTLEGGQTLEAAASDKHQLVYFVAGKGSIELEGKTYDVGKGSGVYLMPNEGASVSAAAGETVKLFHLVVPQIPA